MYGYDDFVIVGFWCEWYVVVVCLCNFVDDCEFEVWVFGVGWYVVELFEYVWLCFGWDVGVVVDYVEYDCFVVVLCVDCYVVVWLGVVYCVVDEVYY